MQAYAVRGVDLPTRGSLSIQFRPNRIEQP
jgi:hypothetical protein